MCARLNLLISLLLALLQWNILPVEGAPFARWANETATLSADFIVIGGGTAGMTVAARLAENNHTVLLLEAGGFPDTYGLPYDSPALTGEMVNTPVDWNFTSSPVPGLNGRSVAQHRGFCLGGTSSINGLTYGRGSRSIYDNWERIGNPGWAWDDIQPYFERTWKFVPPENTSYYRTYDESLYPDQAGPGMLGYTTYNTPSIQAFVESWPSVGVPIATDLNSGNNIGAKHELNTLNSVNQTRISSYSAFWNTTVVRPNFQAVTFAVVERILFRNSSTPGEDPLAYGVQYSAMVNGTKLTKVAFADKEVILSAGTLQTPQVLMLSGIGPTETLESLDIPVVVDNYWVGKNMGETPSFSLIVKVTDEASTNKFQQSTVQQEIAKMAKDLDPDAANNSLNTVDGNSGPAFAFIKLESSELEATGAGSLIVNRSDQAHYEVLLWTSLYPLPEDTPALNDYYNFTAVQMNESYVSLSSYLLAPLTFGNITINSTEANASPIINLPFYEDPGDMNIQLLSFKRLRTLISQPQWAPYVIGPGHGEIVPGPNVTADDDITQFIRETSVSVAHQSGTAAMRPREDQGVVNPALEVYGVQGLRVIDASIIPVFVDQHPQAAVYMIAEKGAQLLIDKFSG